MASNTQYYVDFDGTIAPGDPNFYFFKRWAADSWEALDNAWHAGEISSRVCMAAKINKLRVSLADYETYANAVELDPWFKRFVTKVRAQGAGILIVSDGLDQTITPALSAAHLDIPVAANRLRHVANDRWAVEFPFRRTDCANDMGTCKCAHIAEHKPTHSVLIGDGRSDFCLAEKVDFVFAKGALAEFCEQRGLAHEKIKTFEDVCAALDRAAASFPDHVRASQSGR